MDELGTDRASKGQSARMLRISLAIFMLALAIRLPLALRAVQPQVDGTESTYLARSLARAGSYADALGTGTGPTAHLLPGAILPQALALNVFGLERAGSAALIALTCLEAALGLALLPPAGLLLFGSARAGAIAGLIGALFPANWYPQASGRDEAALAFCVTALTLLLFAYHTARRHPPGMLATAGIGAVLGLGFLVSASFAPVVLLAFALGLAAYRDYLGAYLGRCALGLAVIAVVMAPWVARNYLVFHELIPFRTNLGLEVQVSNNDLARPLIMDNSQAMSRLHPFHNPGERARLVALGEVAYNRDKLRVALDWIGRNPERFASLTLQRAAYFWFPAFSHPAQEIACWAITTLGLIGLAGLFRQRHHGRWLILAYLAGFSWIYVVVQASGRYRFPLEPILLLLAAFVLDRAMPVKHNASGGRGRRTRVSER